MNNIFVQIASYRDPQLIPTLKSMIENAKNPKKLIIGICRQYHPDDKFDVLDEYKNDTEKDDVVSFEEAAKMCGVPASRRSQFEKIV